MSGKIWEAIMELVKQEETFRNAQVTLMAPTGTISFLMDAQTTGVEPEFSHVKYKRLSNTDGSILTTISPLTRTCLENLKYDRDKINEIEYYIKENKPLNKCKSIDKSHTSIFDVSSCSHEDQLISYTGHIKMLAAIQPFISGGISKTINLPNNATVEDVFKCYLECWKMGLKGVTVYRDGSKNYQPLSNKEDDENINRELELPEIMTLEDMKQNERLIKHLHAKLAERKLPPERPAMIYKFNVGGVKGFLTCGLYDDGDLGEIFINISKEGSTLSGLLDCLATAVSISLQSGVPLKDFVEKMIWQKFEPYGFTTDKDIKTATSLVDFIFKYLGMKFLNKNDQIELGLITQEDVSINKQSESFEEVDINNEEVKNDFNNRSLLNTFAGPSCNNCGSIMIKKGNCFLCMNCGSNNGACG
jgi:ribonucleoside-diphosphate reductase alpha chain